MKSKLGNIAISLLDQAKGVVRLHCDSVLNIYGRKLATTVGERVKGIKAVIVIDEIIIECETNDPESMKRLARSYVRALNNMLEKLDEEQIAEITGPVTLGNSMAVHSGTRDRDH